MNTSRRSFLTTSTLASAGLLLGARAISAAEAPPRPAADIWETFRNRRSVRGFKSTTVPDADLRQILDAARLAPTSGNQQPWKFLVVRDPAKLAALKAACIEWRVRGGDSPVALSDAERQTRTARAEENYSGYFSAPVQIVILTDGQSKYPDYNHWDGPLAAGYLMLAARALGYGTVFITDAIPEAVTKRVLNIPDRYTRVCITPLGVPDAWPASPKKKSLEDFIAFESL